MSDRWCTSKPSASAVICAQQFVSKCVLSLSLSGLIEVSNFLSSSWHLSTLLGIFVLLVVQIRSTLSSDCTTHSQPVHRLISYFSYFLGETKYQVRSCVNIGQLRKEKASDVPFFSHTF